MDSKNQGNEDDFLKFVMDKSVIFNKEVKSNPLTEYPVTGFISYFAVAWVEEHLTCVTNKIESLNSRMIDLNEFTVDETFEMIKEEAAEIASNLPPPLVARIVIMTKPEIKKKLREDKATVNRGLEVLENALIVLKDMQEVIDEQKATT